MVLSLTPTTSPSQKWGPKCTPRTNFFETQCIRKLYKQYNSCTCTNANVSLHAKIRWLQLSYSTQLNWTKSPLLVNIQITTTIMIQMIIHANYLCRNIAMCFHVNTIKKLWNEITWTNNLKHGTVARQNLLISINQSINQSINHSITF